MIDSNRAHGLLEGLAIGNLLGVPVESWPKLRILEQYPDGIRDLHASPEDPDDDDLAQAIIIAEAAKDGNLDIDALAKRFWDWAEVNGTGIGNLTYDVLTMFGGQSPRCMGKQHASNVARPPAGMPITEASRQAWSGCRAGNGALMRCAPLALRWADKPSTLVRESVLSAVPTHWDSRCGWSCAVANLATAAALRDESLSPKALLNLAKQGMIDAQHMLDRFGYVPDAPDSVVDAVEQASRSELADLRFDGDDMGYTLITLQAMLIAFWRADDFATTVSEIVAAGGDTDTNGAVVGALLGAKFGSGQIPDQWRTQLPNIRAGRESLTELADALLVG